MCAPAEKRHKKIKQKEFTFKIGYLDLKASITEMETSHIFLIKAVIIMKIK
jgi:hypothetical protein